MRTNLLPLIISLILASCNMSVVEEDYRDPFVGTFHFTSVHRTIAMCNQPSPECVNGWTTILSETSSLVSEVTALETDRIRIVFGTDTIGDDDNDSIITETMHPIVSENGLLTLPEYPIGGHNSFEGTYSSIDTIRLTVKYGFLNGGYDQYDVIGIREN